MSQNIGTLISSSIRPNNSLDPIATAFGNEIKGGHHTYQTILERNSIIEERREWGMHVTIYNDGINNKTYELRYNYIDSDINNNANWVEFTFTDQQVITNIRISAYGTDLYTGSATPSIATYSVSDLYLVDFENANTGSTVSLDIDGIGPIDVITFDSSGSIGLTGGGEITPGQIYYITWDGDNFQLYLTNPRSSSPVSYTNASPVPSPLGGIDAGMTFSETTMKQMWDLLLYPYQQPNFTLFTFNHGGSTREVGNAILSGTYSFTWNISYPANVSINSLAIRDITSPYTLISGTANDGIAGLTLSTINKTSAASHQWKASALRTNGTLISNTLTVSWLWMRFSGTQSDISLTASQIQSLSSSGLSTSRTGTYNFGVYSYKYFSWPTAFGGPIQFKDSSTNLVVSMAGIDEGYTTSIGSYFAKIVPITNTYGVTTNYYLFRSKNILGGSISIVVT